MNIFVELKGGAPSHHTIGRIFSAINPVEFRKIFATWMNECQKMTHGSIIGIDGKCLRSSYSQEAKKDQIYMVIAFAEANEVVLGQVKVDKKSNEITAIPKLLNLLDIKGTTITIDAMGCQIKIADKTVDLDGDFILALKGDQDELHEDVKLYLDSNLNKSSHNQFDFSEDVHGDHDRYRNNEIMAFY